MEKNDFQNLKSKNFEIFSLEISEKSKIWNFHWKNQYFKKWQKKNRKIKIFDFSIFFCHFLKYWFFQWKFQIFDFPEISKKNLKNFRISNFQNQFSPRRINIFLLGFFSIKVWMATIDSARLRGYILPLGPKIQRKPSKPSESGVTGIFSHAASYFSTFSTLR